MCNEVFSVVDGNNILDKALTAARFVEEPEGGGGVISMILVTIS